MPEGPQGQAQTQAAEPKPRRRGPFINRRLLNDGDVSTVTALGKRRKLFFASGHPRSGTTWLGAVLKRHPRIHCDGEFSFQILLDAFDAFRGKVSKRGRREPVHSLAERCFQDTVRLLLSSCSVQAPDAEWIGDRTPKRLEVMLPGASHFVIYRDGRDVLVSTAIMHINGRSGPCAQHNDHPRLAPALRAFENDPDHFKKHPDELLACEPFVRKIARRWAWQIRQDKDTVRRIREGELDARVFEIHYEDLHANTEARRAEMYEFLGLDPAEALPLTRESRTLPGLGQDDHRSDKRKGEVGDWQNYFTADAAEWFEAEAGHAMTALGYTANRNA